ncbi:MAG: PRC-barrel domain-containing protein [Prochlorotrichaceae cyanobacterium]
MARKPSVIRHSELLHCLVLDRSTTDDRGRVELLWMYPQVHRVLGFICKIGLMNQQHFAFTLPQIQAISEKNVWVTGEPTEADPAQLNQLETLLYHEVWSESGAPLGKIKDCLFELKTGKITQYLVALRGWRSVVSELYPLPPAEVLSFGKKRLLVSDRAGEEIQKQQDRIQQTLVGLRQDYQTLKQEVLQFSQRAQNLTQETVQKTVKTVKDLGTQLSELGENVAEFREDLRDPEDAFDFPEPPRPQPGVSPPKPDNSATAAATAAWVEQVKVESEQWTDEFEDEEFPDDEFADDQLLDEEFEDEAFADETFGDETFGDEEFAGDENLVESQGFADPTSVPDAVPDVAPAPSSEVLTDEFSDDEFADEAFTDDDFDDELDEEELDHLQQGETTTGSKPPQGSPPEVWDDWE